MRMRMINITRTLSLHCSRLFCITVCGVCAIALPKGVQFENFRATEERPGAVFSSRHRVITIMSSCHHGAATLLASGIAAGGCSPYCNSCPRGSSRSWSCTKEVCSWRLLNGLYQLREEFLCRATGAQSRSSPDKWLLREEVADRRGASAKRSVSEEAVQNRKVAHSSIHPRAHASIHSFVHQFSFAIDLLIHWFIGSLVHCFIGSLIH